MATAISATDAVRQGLPNCLTTSDTGARATRSSEEGKPAASLVPVGKRPDWSGPLGELRGIFSTLPQLDPADTVAFMEDVLSAVASQPSLPEKSVWE